MSGNFNVNGVEYQAITKPVIGICLDGTSPEYLEQAIAAGMMPTLGRLQKTGTFTIADALMPSYTNPNNIGIATGTTPDKNGICGNYFYDAETQQEIMMDKPEYLRVPTIFSAAAEVGYRVAVVTAKNKLLKLLSAGLQGIAFSGEKADLEDIPDIGNIADRLQSSPPHYSEININQYTMQAAVLVFREWHPDLMYISLTDGVQHRSGPGEPEANEMLSQVDEGISELLDLGATIGITADHGMNFKIDEEGQPKIIFLESLMEGCGSNPKRVILPITDPHVSHHGCLGSFAMIYCSPEDLDQITRLLQETKGISQVLDRNSAAKLYRLPPERIGDLIIIADQDTVLGKTPSSHDLSALKGPLRSHGGLAERKVPFIFSKRITDIPAKPGPENYQLFKYLINNGDKP